MNATLAPIPTTFKGIQFRSRLEARWAMFFDLSGFSWRYEHVRVSPSYIPDFDFPDTDVIVEIKPRMPSREYLDHLERSCNNTGLRVLLLAGSPGMFGDQSKLAASAMIWDFDIPRNVFVMTSCRCGSGMIARVMDGIIRIIPCDCSSFRWRPASRLRPEWKQNAATAQHYRFDLDH